MNGGRQICFTDSKGKALFSIPDGGIIRLFYGNGDDYFAICRYLDEARARIDGVDYPYGNLHGGWNKMELAMPLHKSRSWTTRGLIRNMKQMILSGGGTK